MYVLLAVLALPLVYIVVQYNALIALKNHIRDAWSNVDTELKRRYDLIPNLVSTVRGYADHEQDVFRQIAELRSRCLDSRGAPGEQAADEVELVGALKQFMAVVENYPRLKSDQHFLELQRELVITEDRIQAARRFFNGNVRDYQVKCESFPSNLVAKGFGFQREEYFRVPPSVKEVPDVDF